MFLCTARHLISLVNVMKAKYDESVDAMYIELKEAKPKIVDKTIALNEDLIVDFDKDKKIIGIEILNASKL